ncbi:MAG: hypothetical protein LKJ48_01675 [Lactobacillus sp.]|jgi:hypothetical protein|nr:hypothetical protein [Lactobacillus sp.]
MFQKPAFQTPQIRHVVDFLRDTGSYGGFPINHVNLVRDTGDLAYLDLDFKITAAITQPTFAEMCKYILVVAGSLEKAPMPIYYAIMQHSLDELSITYHIYDAHTADIYYWQAPPIVAAPEPDDHLHFR